MLRKLLRHLLLISELVKNRFDESVANVVLLAYAIFAQLLDVTLNFPSTAGPFNAVPLILPAAAKFSTVGSFSL